MLSPMGPLNATRESALSWAVPKWYGASEAVIEVGAGAIPAAAYPASGAQ